MHPYWLSCGESRGNHDNVHRSHRMTAPNPKVQLLTSIHDRRYGRRPIALTQGSKRDPIPPFKFLGCTISPFCFKWFLISVDFVRTLASNKIHGILQTCISYQSVFLPFTNYIKMTGIHQSCGYTGWMENGVTRAAFNLEMAGDHSVVWRFCSPKITLSSPTWYLL